ncbi:MAG: cysteine desulfurase [Desulfobulbaceae bacterium]|nr:cysteine desulfurase [Desulfobulbaceae bacterium]
MAMLPYLDDLYGNPSSGHRFGEAARAGIEEARQQVAELLQTTPNRLIFTSGGSEANNLAIWSAVFANLQRKHIITSVVEHDSVLAPLAFLRERLGYEITILPVNQQGDLDLAELSEAIRPDTLLVSLMGANNETGVLWPVEKIGAICRERAVFFHCDAVQLVGKYALDLATLPVDYLTISAHKLHGPKGVGLLYARRSVPVSPMIMGSGQENGFRSGTENAAGIVGFGKACQLAGGAIEAHSEQLQVLRNRLEAGIIAEIPEVQINGGKMARLANTINVSFKHASGAAMIQELDERGIAVSAHAACHSGDLNPSHVLLAMGVAEPYLHGTLRISLSRFNTMAEVEEVLAVLPGIVAKSRQGFAL